MEFSKKFKSRQFKCINNISIKIVTSVQFDTVNSVCAQVVDKSSNKYLAHRRLTFVHSFRIFYCYLFIQVYMLIIIYKYYYIRIFDPRVKRIPTDRPRLKQKNHWIGKQSPSKVRCLIIELQIIILYSSIVAYTHRFFFSFGKIGFVRCLYFMRKYFS